MPREIRAAIDWAAAEDEVHVIIVEGAGKGFCGGYDLNHFGEGNIDHPCQQEQFPWDPMVDYAYMKRNTELFMSLWRSPKPTIAKVHGYAAAGGSDIALCCDFLGRPSMHATATCRPASGAAPPRQCGPTAWARPAPNN